MKLAVGDDVSETLKFTAMFDRFFDCLNVNSFTRGKHKRKVFQDPYRSADDFSTQEIKVLLLFFYTINI